MKSKIICLVLSLVLVVGLFGASGTYAWFATYGEGSGGILHNFKTGNIGYTLVGSFSLPDGNIQPEVELLSELENNFVYDGIPEGVKMYLSNNSLVDTQLRVKITYTYFDFENKQVTDIDYDGAENSPLFVGIAEGWNFLAVGEETTNADGTPASKEGRVGGYFYYGDEDTAIPDVAESTQYIPLFTSLKYSGPNSDFPANLYDEDTKFTVKVIFEAKQADYVTWEVIGEMGFEAAPYVPETTTQSQAS